MPAQHLPDGSFGEVRLALQQLDQAHEPGRAAGARAGPLRRSHPGGAGRASLPLHRLRQDPRGRGGGCAADAGGVMTGVVGAPLKRKEDPRLLRGDGRYLADLKAHGMLAAVVVRSPHPHAWIRSVDASAARADQRTLAVLTAADLPELPPLPCIDAEETTRPFNQRVLASDKVRYVGEPVAVVVAADRYVAEDLAELVVVDYEPLPAVADAERAMEPGAPILHEETNVCDTLEYKIGDPDAAFESAPHVLTERFTTQR